MRYSILGVVVLTGIAHGAITNARAVGATNTQAILAYTAPSEAACTIEVSENSGYSPLVYAVDAGLFPGSNGDGGGNTARVFVVGKRTVGTGADGRKYSLALQAFTTHYFRITCGADQATGTFQTANILFGSTRQDSLEADPDRPGEYLLPTQADTVIDPKTGAMLKRISTTYADTIAGTTGASGYSFTAATGDWSNPANILANDSAYASTTSGGWLWVRLGGQYPDSSTFSNNQLSFQNLNLTGYCSGTDCSAGGQTLEVCVTRQGVDDDGPHCELPIRQINLPSTNGTVTLCNDAGACSTTNRPGDFLSYEQVPKDDWKASNGTMYNSGYGTAAYFTDIKDCHRLFTGESMRFFIANGSYAQFPAISALNCSASPPSATFDQGIDLSYNSTTGVPFYFRSGIYGNPRYGFLIRKANASASSTVYLNYANWRAASYIQSGFSYGSGGFSQVCSEKADANGFYHCYAGNQKIYGIRTESDGTLTVRFLGMAWFAGQTVTNGGVESGFTLCLPAANDFLWDPADPNVFYCNATSSANGSAVLVKGAYTGNDVARAFPDPMGSSETDRWPQLPATYTNMTPCLGSCTSDSDNYTLSGQLKRYAASKTPAYDATAATIFSRCGIESIQGNSAVGSCKLYQQDSFAWLFVMDLGNRQPMGGGFSGNYGNTQQLFAADPAFSRRGSRFCGLHTYQNDHSDFAMAEFAATKEYPFMLVIDNALSACNKSGTGTCSACPSITVDGYNYTGKNYCDTIQASSSSLWNAAWGTSPPNGTPIRNNDSGTPVTDTLHQIGAFMVGDIIRLRDNCNGNLCEYVKLLQQNDATHWVVERGFHRDQSSFAPRAHSAAQSHNLECANNPDPTTSAVLPEGAAWYFLEDSDATGYGLTYFYSPFVNHALGRNNFRLTSDYHYSFAPFTDKAAMAQAPGGWLRVPLSFGTALSMAEGNSVEKHPSYNQYDAPLYDQRWFLDANPYLFATNQNGASARVTGQLYKYQYSGQIDPKYYSIAAFTGQSVSRDISGPGSSITGGVSDSYKHCYASLAGECYSGSQPGELYMNVPAVDASLLSCKEAEFYSGWRDLCATNFNALGGSYAQWRIPATDHETVYNGAFQRVITRARSNYRGSSTDNWKPTPDGRWGMLRNEYMVKLPPFPDRDSVVRDQFIPMLMYLDPPAGLAVDNAFIEFGYDDSFRCTDRNESCVASGATINTTSPFWFRSESGWSGMSCSSGCTITVPAISQRVLYYRVVYRNAAGQVIGTSSASAMATP